MNRALIDLPDRMMGLARDTRGYPVPKFVKWIDGEPDFRVADTEHLYRCAHFDRCWICAQPLGVHKTFVIGPMCCVNRVSSEPPSHYECGRFAALNCPFLTKPLAKRKDISDLGQTHVAGEMIERNPGVCALWITRGFKIFNAGGMMFELGEPERVEFYAHGRLALKEEIDQSVETGLPLLEDAARREGGGALKALDRSKHHFEILMSRFGP